jgi:pimeloyl-ACP methyl ester carboxylesterase
MSGKFAQYVALRRPERVSGLVLVAGFPAAEMAFPQDVVRDWVSRAGDRERLHELIVPFISEPVDAPVLDRYVGPCDEGAGRSARVHVAGLRPLVIRRPC